MVIGIVVVVVLAVSCVALVIGAVVNMILLEQEVRR